MDLASGFAQPSLACAEQIWEWGLKLASATNTLVKYGNFSGVFGSWLRPEEKRSAAETSAGALS
jgi:hypothetical protein